MRELFRAALAMVAGVAGVSDFATRVLEYRPGPGWFINAPGAEGIYFNDSDRAIGPPVGGGTLAPNNSKLVTLGWFGGSITLGFDHLVEDCPCNPLGLDAIVFGNGLWWGTPQVRAADAGVIEISRDTNGNTLADDKWFVIRGSSLPEVPSSVSMLQLWDNSASTTQTPPTNVALYPAPPFFPEWPAVYSTATFRLPAAFNAVAIVNPNGSSSMTEGHYGYADMSPTLLRGDMSGADGHNDNSLSDPEDLPGISPGEFYTSPDDPMRVGVDPGSGGGDAFDIAWAVDPLTGEPANLDGFDFIRISTGPFVLNPSNPLVEKSTEISAVADVLPRVNPPGDANNDGMVDFTDLNIVLGQFNQSGAPGTLSGDFDCDGQVTFADLNQVLSRWGQGG